MGVPAFTMKGYLDPDCVQFGALALQASVDIVTGTEASVRWAKCPGTWPLRDAVCLDLQSPQRSSPWSCVQQGMRLQVVYSLPAPVHPLRHFSCHGVCSPRTRFSLSVMAGQRLFAIEMEFAYMPQGSVLGDI